MPRKRLPTREAVVEAARALRAVLGAVEAGELDASDPKDVAAVRRLQGALTALEQLTVVKQEIPWSTR